MKTNNQIRYTTYVINANGKKEIAYEYRDVISKPKQQLSPEEVAEKKNSKLPRQPLGQVLDIPLTEDRRSRKRGLDGKYYIVSGKKTHDVDGNIIVNKFYSKFGKDTINEYRQVKKEIDTLTKKVIELPNGFKKTVKVKLVFRKKPSLTLTAKERETRLMAHKQRITEKVLRKKNTLSLEEQTMRSRMLTMPVSTDVQKHRSTQVENIVSLTAKAIVTEPIIETTAERKERQRNAQLEHTKKIYKVGNTRSTTVATKDAPKSDKIPKKKNVYNSTYHKTTTYGSTLAEKMKEHNAKVMEDFRIIILRKTTTTNNGTTEFSSTPFTGTKIDAQKAGLKILHKSEKNMSDVAGVRVVSRDPKAEKALNIYFHSYLNFKKSAA